MGKGQLQGSGPTAGTLAAVGALGCQHSLLWLQGLTMGALPWRLVLAIRLEVCRCPAGGVPSDEPGGAGQWQARGPGVYCGCRVSPGACTAVEVGHEGLVGSVHVLSGGGR